ncbi:hypothetical protein [Mumia zhuanghuii]|uniref:hypothetical protein n=1 Tax=Mumia zhuanghuii TaxID=2585211 RepID=UPI0036347888
MATDDTVDTIRTELRRRLAGLAMAAVLGVGAVTFWYVVSGSTELGDLRRARALAATQTPQKAVVVDVEDLSAKESEGVGGGSAVVRLPDGAHADLWTLDTGLAAFFGGPDKGERLEVLIDPKEPTWAASADDVEASFLARARFLAVSFLLRGGILLVLARRLLTVGDSIPLRAFRTLLYPRDHVSAEVVAVLHSDKRKPHRVTLRIRVGEDEYSWDATLPPECVPYAGGTLDLRGDVRDGGWVMAVDEKYGVAYPRSPLRQWGAEPPTQSWHPPESGRVTNRW